MVQLGRLLREGCSEVDVLSRIVKYIEEATKAVGRGPRAIDSGGKTVPSH